MKIAVIHDYADAMRKTRAYDKLRGHEVVVHTDAYTYTIPTGSWSRRRAAMRWCSHLRREADLVAEAGLSERDDPR